ncbi:hypothetical protein Bpfe_031044, partial [Biomphalaria pfeifferi]
LSNFPDPGFQSAEQSPPVCKPCRNTKRFVNRASDVQIRERLHIARIPSGLMMNKPRRAMLASSTKMLYFAANLPPTSEIKGYASPSMPF